MTVSQANTIIKLLPLGYTLLPDRECKNKRLNNRKKNNPKKETNAFVESVEPAIERNKKINNSVKYNDEAQVLSNYNRANSQIYYEDMEESMKPCLKLLQMLKNNKTSWPFR